MIQDDLPDTPEWGLVAPSIASDLANAGRRHLDLRAVATAYKYATAFTCDHILATELAANALQYLHPARPRSVIIQDAIELIAYASRAYGTWLNDGSDAKLEVDARLGVRSFAWSEQLKLYKLGIDVPP